MPNTTPAASQPSSDWAPEELTRLRQERDHLLLAYRTAVQRGDFLAGFLARTAHELRSPLSSTIGLHQMILNDLCDSPEEERDFIDQANEAALRLVALLDRLVEASKLSQGAVQPEIQSVIVADQFEEVDRLTRLQAANRNFSLEVVVPDRDLWALGDPKRLRQALIGAIEATIHHLVDLGQGGMLRLRAETDPTRGRVQIFLDSTCPLELWSEPLDLLNQTTHPQPMLNPSVPPRPPAGSGPPQDPAALGRGAVSLSPSLLVWVAQLLLESMEGSLGWMAIQPAEPPWASRLAFELPLDLE